MLLLCVTLLGIVPRKVDAQPAEEKVQALFVSDVHFDPFWDPNKVTRLAAAPVTQWPSIAAAPASPNRQQAFDALEQACPARGLDTSYALLQSSINAMKAHGAGTRFILLSGDLMAHGFDCKYRKLLPGASAEDYRAFTEKTIRFVMQQLNGVARGVPVYAALGNNDSDCGDYRIDANSAFLQDLGPTFTQGISRRERGEALRSFSAGGNYSVMLPAPMQNTRLIVLEDVFFSAKRTSCSGKPDKADQDAQLAWLKQELEEARTAKQRVWIMGHIPPGVDAYKTLAHLSGACGRPPLMMLSSDALAETLTGASDVVALAIFGHTHEDEIKLLRREPSDGSEGIPVKIIPAISPINGNLPSFTVAQIDPATATLVNYAVIAGSERVPWAEQYDYAKSYGESSFSAAAVKDLVAKFAADSDSKTPASEKYIHHFVIGNPIPLLSLVWPQYVCTMMHESAKGFTLCACPARNSEPQTR